MSRCLRLAASQPDPRRMYGLEIVQAAGVVGLASDAAKSQAMSGPGSTENPFDSGPGGVNERVPVNSNIAPGFDPVSATCLLTSMFRDEFANLIAHCPSINMCGRSLVGQCLHNLSLPRAQFDRRDHLHIIPYLRATHKFAIILSNARRIVLNYARMTYSQV
jgi:hypothetical protein